MKLVKKLLRLFPFIIILLYSLICCFSLEISITAYGDINNNMYFIVSSLLNNFQTLLSGFGFGYGGDFTFFDPLYEFFQDTLGIYGTLFDLVIQIMIYELILSLLFLMFDVFNFILGVANKWIKKGGNLDD